MPALQVTVIARGFSEEFRNTASVVIARTRGIRNELAGECAAIREEIRMRSKFVFATLAAAAIGLILIAHGCSKRKDGAATKVETAGDAGAGDKSQSAEFSLSAKDDEGFDLPEREEIRQKRKLAPGTKVFVIGFSDAKVDSDGKEVIVMGI